MKYKNIGQSDIIIRAAESAEKPNVKKIYRVAKGAIVDFPVPISAQNLELVDSVKTTDNKKQKELM